jgi:hypothetical protein
MAYSRRRVEQLKKGIVSFGRITAIYGNSCALQEKVQVSAARECFDAFVQEAGCPQPHRSIRRRLDDSVHTLVLLSMNTTKTDVYEYVNSKVQRICEKGGISRTRFWKLWKEEYPHVQIPPYSRFSKCFHCWEYKCVMEATTNTTMKAQMKEKFKVYTTHQIEERRDYWKAKRSAILDPGGSMCLIVDGMDQNTTMIPKMKQIVKSMESRFVKTHLCGVIVHGVGLYADVWFNAHHLHDSNQVVTSIMHAIGDVQARQGKLPLVLQIQADNCGQENKNIYMFGLCAALVA